MGFLDALEQLVQHVRELPPEEALDALNQVRTELHKVSPMKAEPVDCVLWVPAETVSANDYNPNTVAAPEMALLKHSVLSDHFTQPIVAWGGEGSYEVVDGYHRNRVGREVKTIRKRLLGRLPVSVINGERCSKEDRIAATIRHNRARGKHRIDAMSEIVAELAKRNWSNTRIAKELGMDPDEVLRLKQVTGLAELFAGQDFSEAWDAP